jgi:hypothetical protein
MLTATIIVTWNSSKGGWWRRRMTSAASAHFLAPYGIHTSAGWTSTWARTSSRTRFGWFLLNVRSGDCVKLQVPCFLRRKSLSISDGELTSVMSAVLWFLFLPKFWSFCSRFNKLADECHWTRRNLWSRASRKLWKEANKIIEWSAFSYEKYDRSFYQPDSTLTRLLFFRLCNQNFVERNFNHHALTEPPGLVILRLFWNSCLIARDLHWEHRINTA